MTKINVRLYWILANECWSFEICQETDILPDYNPDGAEYHGDYVITLPAGASLYWVDDILPMIDYRGELHDLHTIINSGRPVPCIYCDGKAIYLDY